MAEIRIFISSVQSEFAEERKRLCEYIRTDALLGKFFRPFIFEELPAINLSAPEAYINEVKQSDIYLGIFGDRYGYEDTDGISPTAPEFEQDENFLATIRRKNVGQNVGQSKQAVRYIKILNTLLTNRRTPLRDIAEVLEVSEKTIKRDLNVLRQNYRIEWIGSPKTGRWEIEKLEMKKVTE